MRFIDMTGMRFGRLVAVRREENQGKRIMWRCKCDCGNEVVVRGENLRSGNTKSCGCIEKEHPNGFKHGFSKSRIEGVFLSMKQRCYNKDNYEYDNYGGRGIKICDEWLKDRASFYKWAYENGYDDNADFMECTIDRIDVNKGYSPDNCRWVDRFTQANNTRKNKYFSLNGETHTLAEWSRVAGINYYTLWRKVCKYGLNIEDAIKI